MALGLLFCMVATWVSIRFGEQNRKGSREPPSTKRPPCSIEHVYFHCKSWHFFSSKNVTLVTKKLPLRFVILARRCSSSQYIPFCLILCGWQGHPTQFCLGACVAWRPATCHATCTASRIFLEVGAGLTVPSPQHAEARAKARNKTAA